MNAPRLFRTAFLALMIPSIGSAMLSRHNEQGLSPTHSYKRSGPTGAVSNLNGNLVVSTTPVDKAGAPLGVTLSRTWNSHWRDPLFVFEYDMNHNTIDVNNPKERHPEYVDREISGNPTLDIGGIATRRYQIYDTPARIPEMWAFAQSVSLSMIESMVSQAIIQTVNKQYASFLDAYNVNVQGAKAKGIKYKATPSEQATLDKIAQEKGAALQILSSSIYLMTSAGEDFEMLGECARSATGGVKASGDCGDAMFNVVDGFAGTYVTMVTGHPLVSYAQLGYNLAKGDATAEDLAWTAGNAIAQMIVQQIVAGGVAGGAAGIAVSAAIQMTRLYIMMQAEWAKTYDVGVVHLNPWALGVNGYVGLLGVNHEPEMQRGQKRFRMQWTYESPFYHFGSGPNTGSTSVSWNTAQGSASRHPMPELQLVGTDGGASRYILSDDSVRIVDGRRWVSYVGLSNADRRQVLYCLPENVSDVVDLGHLGQNGRPSPHQIDSVRALDASGYYLVKEPDGTQVVLGQGTEKGIVQDEVGYHTYWAVPTLVRHPVGDSVRIARDASHRITAAWDVRTGRGAEIVHQPGSTRAPRRVPCERCEGGFGTVYMDSTWDHVQYRDVVFAPGQSGTTPPPVVRRVDTVFSEEGSVPFNVYTDKFGNHLDLVQVVHHEARRLNDTLTDTTRFAYSDGDLVQVDYANGSRTTYAYDAVRNSALDGFVQQETEYPDRADGRFWRKRIYDYVGWNDSRPKALKTGVTTVLRTPEYVYGASKEYRESETTDWYHFAAMLSSTNVNRSLAGFKGQTTIIRDSVLHDTDKVLDSMEYKTSRFQLVAEYHGAGAAGVMRKQTIYDGDRPVAELASQGLGKRFAPVITMREYDDAGSVVRERVCPRGAMDTLRARLASYALPGVTDSMLDLSCPERETRYGVRHEKGSEFWRVTLDTLQVKDTVQSGMLTVVSWTGHPNPDFQPRGLYQLGIAQSQRTWRTSPSLAHPGRLDSALLGDSTEYEDWKPQGSNALALIRPVRTRVYDPGKVPGESWPVATQIAYADDRDRPTLPARTWKRLNADSAALLETDYDASIALWPVETRAYPTPTSLGGAAVGEPLTTSRTYDLDRGWVLSEIAPGNRTTSTHYDRSGRVTRKILPDGATVETRYVDRLEDRSTWRSEGSVLGYATSYPNQRTVAVREIDPVGVTTEARFDGLGRMVALRKLAAGAPVSTKDTAHQQTTLLAYSLWDKLQWKRDPSGREEFHDYDGVGRLISSKVYIDPRAASSLSLSWENRYEWDDLRKTLTEIDPLGTKTVFHSDLLGRDTLIERDAELLDIQPTGDASAGLALRAGGEKIAVHQAYANTGEPVRIVDPKGLIETRRYDVRGRLVETNYPDDLRHALGYDLAGRAIVDTLQAMRNGAAVPESLVVKAASLDALDRVTEERFVRGGTAGAAGFGSREDVRFHWDRFGTAEDPGQLLGLERGTGLVARYAYDRAGRRTERHVADAAIGYDVAMSTAYDPAGMPRSLSLPGGARFSSSFDGLHRLASLSLVRGGDSIPLLHGATYRMDDLATGYRLGGRLQRRLGYEPHRPLLSENLVARLRAGSSSLVEDTVLVQRLAWDASGDVAGMLRASGDSLGFQRDRLGQSRITLRRDGYDTLAYDANGNRTRHRYSLDGGIVDSFTTIGNRASRVTSGRKGVTLLRHDLQGNLALEADFASPLDTADMARAWRLVERRYNRRNELERARVIVRLGRPDTTLLGFVYGEDGNRIASLRATSASPSDTAWDVVHRWAYDGAMIVADSSADHGWTWHGYNGLNRIAEASDSSGSLRVRYVLTDHQGSTQALLDDTGAVLGRWTWDPWGNLEQSWTTRSTELLYQGKAYEPTLANWYFNARWYDPEMGRFTSRDPSSQFYSPYSYVGNMPLRAVDPDGRDAIVVVFPDYKISAYGMKVPYLGHAGVVLINNKTGATRYYEYGRYDEPQELGIVVRREVPDVVIRNGEPTEGSLAKLLASVSSSAGHGTRVEGVYLRDNKFKEMVKYAEAVKAQGNNPNREPYSFSENNCGDFAVDVAKIGTPSLPSSADLPSRPNGMISDLRDMFRDIDWSRSSGLKIENTQGSGGTKK